MLVFKLNNIINQALTVKRGGFKFKKMIELKKVAEITISYKPTNRTMPIVVTSFDSYIELKEFFPEDLISLQEQFVVMYLNKGNRVLGVYKLSKGSITGTVADVRLILGTALKAAACSIVLCHNHPSGSLKPSNADIQITEKIKQAAVLMEIKLIDHLIISPENKYYSFADQGII